MIRISSLGLLVAVALPSCVVYGDGLFDDGNTGGATSGGSGGTASGSSTSTGGTGSDSSGGAPSGGTGGSGTGGGDTGGTSGTGGTGGNGPETLIDDFSGKAATYENPPFAGEWQRTGQTKPAITWDAGNVSAMIQEIPDETGNWAIHVKADAPNPSSAPSDEWGGEVFASLVDSPTGTISLATYTHIAFRARAIDGDTLTLKVMLEDEASTYALCTPSCPAHASRTASLTVPANGWTEIKIGLSTFMRASPAFDLTKVHGVHFQMDPVDTNSVIDFWIDDLRFLTE